MRAADNFQVQEMNIWQLVGVCRAQVVCGAERSPLFYEITAE